MDDIYIYGKHAVIEALRLRPDTVSELWLQASAFSEGKTKSLIKGIKMVRTIESAGLPKAIARDAVHQGYVALIKPSKLVIPFRDFKKSLVVTPDTALVVLGEVQDPHNVGAIIRSAAAFGAQAVLLPEHRGCPVTGTVIKVSAGTAFSMPLISVGNINNAVRDLKESGFWVYGLDGEGDTSLPQESFTKPSVFIVGNEATGMRLKTHELCDTVLTIPMHPRAESLNASVSAAVVLSTWSAQHPTSLQ